MDAVAIVVIERLDIVHVAVKEVLGAALWGQVGVVTGVLGNLYR